MQRPSGSKKFSGRALVVLITARDAQQAVKIGKRVVEARLAACANVLSPIRSIYRWEGKMVVGKETLVILKSTADRYPALEKLVLQLHSYQVPEIIALPVKRGFKQYLGWIVSEVHT